MSAWDFVPRPVSSTLVFVLCLPPAWALSVWLHELGHVAFGRAAGDWIVAAGLGSGKPFWKRKIGATVFYLAGNWWLSGQTLRGIEGVYPNRRRLLLSTLGGPVASVMTMAATLAIWNLLTPSEPVAALFYASLWASQTILPYATRRRDGTMMLSDGMLVLRTWQGKLRAALPTAQAIQNLTSFRRIAAELGIPEAERSYALAQALCYTDIGALPEAEALLREWPTPDETGQSRLTRLNALARASLAVASDPTSAGPSLEQARALSGAGTADEVATLLLMADAQGDPEAAQGCREEAARRARNTGWRDLEALANAAAEARGRPVETARYLLGPGRDDLGQLERLSLALKLLPLLERQGLAKESAELFHEVTAIMEAVAADLPDESVRRAFLTKFSGPLRAAVAASDPTSPIWLGGRGQAVGSKADAIHASARRTGVLTAVGLFAVLLIECLRGGISQETWTRLYFQLYGVVILGLGPAYYLLLLTRAGRPLRRGSALCILLLMAQLVINGALVSGRWHEVSRRSGAARFEPKGDGQFAEPEDRPGDGTPR